jgi:hypothetical protein
MKKPRRMNEEMARRYSAAGRRGDARFLGAVYFDVRPMERHADKPSSRKYF